MINAKELKSFTAMVKQTPHIVLSSTTPNITSLIMRVVNSGVATSAKLFTFSFIWQYEVPLRAAESIT
jgi:hypothetical protein